MRSECWPSLHGMRCPTCGTDVQPGQKYCNECGTSLSGASSFTVVEQTAHELARAPEQRTVEAPRTVEQPATVAQPVTSSAPPTSVMAEMTTHVTESYDALMVAPVPTGRAIALLLVSVLAAAMGIVAAAVDLATFEVEGSNPLTMTFRLDDFGSAYFAATVIASVLLVGGAAVGAAGRRVGAGLAGGAALALAGLMCHGCGLAIANVDLAPLEVGYLEPGGRVSTTFESGFFIAIGAMVLGGFAFALAWSVGAHHRRRTPVAVLAIGVIGTILAVVGPLIPVNGAEFSDNLTYGALPPATLLLRLAMLLLVLGGCLIGFVDRRPWGAGLAFGSMSLMLWIWIASLLELGDVPAGPAGGRTVFGVDFLGGNMFAEPKPHPVTSAGIVVTVVAALAGLVTTMQWRRAR